ncbi:EAL domain-containing protein [Termitidicoccus mucosus]|uniref:putative bifunctional diguanylate cyclase/phosphodiesterase n=1 Tax=Termitidicoccus mucosus TaxID=1184151 RepID=UPI000A062A88
MKTTRKKKETLPLLTLLAGMVHKALHDRLTDLPNRFFFDEEIVQNLKDARKSGARIALVLIDLDNFKELNDAYGHKAGDLLLRQLVDRLRPLIPPPEYLVRWGGDEFLWVVPGLESEEKLVARFSDILQAIHVVGRENPLAIELTASIGHAIYPDHSRSLDRLLQLADYAMYQVKNSGKNNFFTGQHDSPGPVGGGTRRILKNRAIPSVLFDRLNASLKTENITFVYQPVRDMDSGAIHSLECLLRWHDEKLGEVLPLEFIPYAERNGLIIPIGYSLMEKAVARLREWKQRQPGLRLSINLSLPQLLDYQLYPTLARLCREHHIAHDDIIFEITERQSFLERPVCQEKLKFLRRHDFHLALDDFGIGWSNFESLYKLPFDFIKIDKTIVQSAHTPKGNRVMNAIVQLCRALGMSPVAEGIETGFSDQVVHELGVSLRQGFFHGPPATENATSALLLKPR